MEGEEKRVARGFNGAGEDSASDTRHCSVPQRHNVHESMELAMKFKQFACALLSPNKCKPSRITITTHNLPVFIPLYIGLGDFCSSPMPDLIILSIGLCVPAPDYMCVRP